MGKYNRRNVASIYVSKVKDQSDYLVFRIPDNEELVFRNGDKLQVESKNFRDKSIKNGLSEGRMTPETAEQLLEKNAKMPDFVRAEVVQLTKRD